MSARRQHEKRKSDVRKYIVMRIKAMEMMDLTAVMQSLPDGSLPLPSFPSGRHGKHIKVSFGTVARSLLATIIDENGTHAIDIWIDLFPAHRAMIEKAWKRMEPGWEVLKAFRDSVGFHGDKPNRYFDARHRLAHSPELRIAVDQFERLFKTLIKMEAAELPDLEDALDSLLDEQGKRLGSRFDHKVWKAYLMVPDTKSGGAISGD